MAKASIAEQYAAIRKEVGSEVPSVKSMELQMRIDELHRENEELERFIAAAKSRVGELEERASERSLEARPEAGPFEEHRVRDERIREYERKVGDLLNELAERAGALQRVKLILEGAHEEVQRLTEENQQLRMLAEKHEQLAQTDELTGLLNRHAFKTLGPSMFSMYQGLARSVGPEAHGHRRENQMDASFNAIFIDLNGFKEINDHIEHAAGDEALKRVADALRSAVRKTDPIFRMGGDEFLVLFVSREDPHKKIAEVGANRFVVAERIRRALERTGFTFKGVKQPGEVEVPALTAMIGVAQYVPRPGEGLNEVVQAADAEALKLKDAQKEEKERAKEGGAAYAYSSRISYAQGLDT